MVNLIIIEFKFDKHKSVNSIYNLDNSYCFEFFNSDKMRLKINFFYDDSKKAINMLNKNSTTLFYNLKDLTYLGRNSLSKRLLKFFQSRLGMRTVPMKDYTFLKVIGPDLIK